MFKILLLLVLAIPPWIASKFDAPGWVLFLSLVPFGLLAMSMGDSDEDLLGEASGSFGRWLFLLLALGGVAALVLTSGLRGTSSLMGAFWWMLPLALAVLVFAVLRFLRK